MTTGSLTAGLSLADTDAAIAALETDVSTLQTLTDVLNDNIHSIVLIDMGNADYTMTDAEANASARVLLNVGDGTKTLTFPTSADATAPVFSVIINQFGSNNVTIASQSGGTTAVVLYGESSPIFYSAGSAITNYSYVYANYTNSVSAGVVTYNALTGTFAHTDTGKLCVFNSTGGAQAWTIDTGANVLWHPSSVINVHVPAGCDGVTITGEVGVTLNPASVVLAAGDSIKLWRDDDTDTWYAA